MSDVSDRKRPPKISMERYSADTWVSHVVYCTWHGHRRDSALCARCPKHLNCRDEQVHEFLLRKQRQAYFVALWGIQKRMLPEEAMTPDPKEDIDEWINE